MKYLYKIIMGLVIFQSFCMLDARSRAVELTMDVWNQTDKVIYVSRKNFSEDNKESKILSPNERFTIKISSKSTPTLYVADNLKAASILHQRYEFTPGKSPIVSVVENKGGLMVKPQEDLVRKFNWRLDKNFFYYTTRSDVIVFNQVTAKDIHLRMNYCEILDNKSSHLSDLSTSWESILRGYNKKAMEWNPQIKEQKDREVATQVTYVLTSALMYCAKKIFPTMREMGESKWSLIAPLLKYWQ